MKFTQSCPTLCNPMGYTVHGILQARILEWVAFPYSTGLSQPRDQTQVSHIAGRLYQLSHKVFRVAPKSWSICYTVPRRRHTIEDIYCFEDSNGVFELACKKSKILGTEIKISTFSAFSSSFFLLKLSFLSKIHHFQKSTISRKKPPSAPVLFVMLTFSLSCSTCLTIRSICIFPPTGS